MRKRMLIIVICLCSLAVLLTSTYCVLRFGFGIDFLDQSRWVEKDGSTIYLSYFGRPVSGWYEVDGCRFYFDPDTGALVTGWLEQDGKKYYIDLEGGMRTGWTQIDGKRYYFSPDGVMATGWLTLGEKRYYLDEKGVALTGWQDINGQRYYLNEESALHSGWLVLSDGCYYVNTEGIAISGWMTGPAGKYFFREDGRMATKWQEVEGKYYYFRENGLMYTGWLELEGHRYYLKPDGSRAVGEVMINGVSNFFTSTGKYVLMVNRWHLMPEGYTPELVDLDGFLVDPICRDALKAMILDCRADGYSCYINNTYRSTKTQQYMWDVRLEQRMAAGMTYDEAVEYTARSLAFVGASEHHLGLAVDINGSNGMYDWLAEHCLDYGFILRYPPDRFEITGIIYEPWHFRYVGVELAKELQELDMCMEEYMQWLTESQQAK